MRRWWWSCWRKGAVWWQGIGPELMGAKRWVQLMLFLQLYKALMIWMQAHFASSWLALWRACRASSKVWSWSIKPVAVKNQGPTPAMASAPVFYCPVISMQLTWNSMLSLQGNLLWIPEAVNYLLKLAGYLIHTLICTRQIGAVLLCLIANTYHDGSYFWCVCLLPLS